MCIIIDANKFGVFLGGKNAEMEPVRKWMKKPESKVAYPKGLIVGNAKKKKTKTEEKFSKEMKNVNKAQVYIRSLWRKKQLNLVEREKIYAAEKELESKGYSSNDFHILALALAGNVKLLVSGDQALHADFKTLIKDGAVYQNKNHRRLLTPDLCP